VKLRICQYKTRSVLNFTCRQEVSTGKIPTTTKIADLFAVGEAKTDNKSLPQCIESKSSI
jgi:hypothetical protein